MGLDTVELVMDVEDAFQIRIEDSEAVAICTVGQLYDCVIAKRDVNRDGPCLSMRVFHVLRRALVALDCPRQAIAPRTMLDDLLPREDRRVTWTLLAESLPYRLPALTLPTFVIAAMAATTIAGIAFSIAGGMASLSVGAAVLGLLLVFAKAWAMHWLTSPLANRFGVGLVTVGDLSKAVLGTNFARVAADTGLAHDREVWNEVRDIVAENFGIAAEEITPDMRFVEDLGV